MATSTSTGPSFLRLATAAGIGIATAVAVGTKFSWSFAPVAGWIVTALIYLSWTWILIGPMDAAATRAHATARAHDDSTHRTAELIVVLSAVASLAGVELLLVASTDGGDVTNASVGVLSVLCSWLTVHTVFTLRYARLYYPDRGIDFNKTDVEPTYADFAYVAFTVGMTYQVSDTNLRSPQMRRAVLAQAMVSFVLGAIILAVTINLVAGLLDVN